LNLRPIASLALLLLSQALLAQTQDAIAPFRAAGPTDSPRIQQLVAAIGLHGNDAVEAFWDEVTKAGAPLVEPISTDGKSSYVTFLWRGEPGTRNVAVIDGVAVGVGDADPARSLMDRLLGTDVWYRTYVVRNDARFHYWLSPNDSLESLELDTRDAHPKPDPLNPHRMSIGLTFVELKDAPISRPTIERRGVPAGEVREIPFHSEVLNNDRKLWVYTPAGVMPTDRAKSYALLIVFDGEAYRSLVPVPMILDNLIHDGTIPPTVAILMTHLDRNQELGASPDFVSFLASELVPWAQRTYRAGEAPAQVALAGSSRGGLAATYAALQRPDVFGKVLAQSPSLWWSPEGSEEGWVPRQYETSDKRPIKLYLEVGDMEALIQRRPIQRMRNILLEKGYEFRFGFFNGNHSYLSWRHSFAPALVYLLGESSTPP